MSLRSHSLFAWVAGSLLLHFIVVGALWRSPAPAMLAAANVMQVQISSEAETSDTDVASDDQGPQTEIVADLSLAALTDQSADSPLADMTSPHQSTNDDYVPGRELQQRPYPVTPVIVPYPEAAQGKQVGSVTLVLFVGVDGKIERVELDRSDLTPEFERAAVETFQLVKMHPGIKDGQATKAKVKILVEFESQ